MKSCIHLSDSQLHLTTHLLCAGLSHQIEKPAWSDSFIENVCVDTLASPWQVHKCRNSGYVDSVCRLWLMTIPFSNWRNGGSRGFMTFMGHTASAHIYPDGRVRDCGRFVSNTWNQPHDKKIVGFINNCCAPRTLLSAWHTASTSCCPPALRAETSWRNWSREVK